MCLVFLKAIGLYDMLTADCESEKSQEGPGSEKPRLMRRSRKKIISLHASIAPKNSASALAQESNKLLHLREPEGKATVEDEESS